MFVHHCLRCQANIVALYFPVVGDRERMKSMRTSINITIVNSWHLCSSLRNSEMESWHFECSEWGKSGVCLWPSSRGHVVGLLLLTYFAPDDWEEVIKTWESTLHEAVYYLTTSGLCGPKLDMALTTLLSEIYKRHTVKIHITNHISVIETLVCITALLFLFYNYNCLTSASLTCLSPLLFSPSLSCILTSLAVLLWSQS